MWEHRAACEVVTRNQHVAAISAFLSAHGAPEDVPIHAVGKGVSKADVVLRGLPHADDRVVVVDDSLAELAGAYEKDERVHRVLFVRVLF